MKKIITIALISFTIISCENTNNEVSNENETTLSDETQIDNELIEKYKEIGFDYASTTKRTLGKNLTDALTEGGPVHALNFCNTRAIPLTDSMSNLYSATIKRASDFYRNPDNEANSKELKQIEYYKDLVAQGKTGKDITPNVELEGDYVHFYYPILTNEMCLQCHGVKDDKVSPETLMAISELYPDDRATGYEDNQVRGIWSIIFEIR